MKLEPIKISAETFCRLARRAAKNGRTVEQELMVLLKACPDASEAGI